MLEAQHAMPFRGSAWRDSFGFCNHFLTIRIGSLIKHLYLNDDVIEMTTANQ